MAMIIYAGLLICSRSEKLISAEGLDIIGMDVEGQMKKARNAISELD